MDWVKELKHYQINVIDNVKNEELLEEAIATCESRFDNMYEDEELKAKLSNRSRPLVMSYLALKHQQQLIRESKTMTLKEYIIKQKNYPLISNEADDIYSDILEKIEEEEKQNLMTLKDIKTLRQVSKEYNISAFTLHTRLKFLEEGVDYIKLGEGKRQPIALSPGGVEKIIQDYK